MRSRIALAVAAAVVFAPGWPGHEAPQPLGESDLAARVLAPTGDVGVIRDAGFDVKHQLSDSHVKRSRPGFTLAAVAALGIGVMALAVLWRVPSHRVLFLRLLLLRFRFSRAPPRLQPA
jgi:hypothetical protein